MARAEARRRTSSACLEALKARFGERVSTAAAILESHGRDESYHAVLPPDAVAFPESVEEIAPAVDAAVRCGGPAVVDVQVDPNALYSFRRDSFKHRDKGAT